MNINCEINKKFELMIVLIFILAAGCNPVSLPSSTSIFQTNKDQANVESTIVPDKTGSESQGALIFNCLHKIYQYDLDSKIMTALVNDEENIYSDIGWRKDDIFYLRTTKKQKEELPTGGAFSPDDIFQMKSDGTKIERITFDDYGDINLAVSPKNGNILYSSDRADDNTRHRYKLIMLNTENKIEKIILEGNHQFLPIWSPSGDKIAILEIPKKYDEKATLYLFDIKLNKITPLISEEYVIFTRISWSPDERFLVVGIKNNNRYSIEFVNVTTGKIANMFPIDNEPGNFAWSPDGERILFETRNRSNKIDASITLNVLDILHDSISVLHIGGIDGRYFAYNATWLPDSRSFAFFVDVDDLYSRLIIQDVVSLQEISSKDACLHVEDVSWASFTSK